MWWRRQRRRPGPAGMGGRRRRGPAPPPRSCPHARPACRRGQGGEGGVRSGLSNDRAIPAWRPNGRLQDAGAGPSLTCMCSCGCCGQWGGAPGLWEAQTGPLSARAAAGCGARPGSLPDCRNRSRGSIGRAQIENKAKRALRGSASCAAHTAPPKRDRDGSAHPSHQTQPR